MITEGHETVNMFGDEWFLPPETSTPMAPQLAYVYEKTLGWPGPWGTRPNDDLGYIPVATQQLENQIRTVFGLPLEECA